MSLIDKLIGRPLATSEEDSERIGPAAGIPTFGLDALSSAAYGPEAALTILLPLGAAGLAYIMPITVAIVVLLVIVFFSYRQTIAAYPSGGGSYTVAHENLGDRAGVLSAAALATDYVLNVAVGISAGVGALISAAPKLQPWTLPLCLGILALLTFVNLRGVREAGVVFMAPTYLFIVTLLGIIGWGLWQTVATGGHPHAVVAPPPIAKTTEVFGVWLLLRAFASGCTAMTGVEAVSNGVQAFRDNTVKNARATLTTIIALLIAMLLGIAFLVRIYHIGATEPGSPHYQSVLSMLIGAVAGRGVVYWITISGILMVLSLSANTSFADFPRLCRSVAEDSFLPRSFSNRGRRLVYTEGIWVLAALSGLLLTIFGGVTDRLIPLFAVGAFLAFTMSQAGMVAHWRKQQRRHYGSMFVNGLGALATAATVIIVILAKFVEGAWVVVALIPCLMLVMFRVRRHYERVERETVAPPRLETRGWHKPIVVVPIEHWSRISQKALRFGLSMSDEVLVVHVECGKLTDEFCRFWPEGIQGAARMAGLPEPELVLVKSPYRFVIQPIVDYVLELERKHHDRMIAVVLPEMVEHRWYEYFLHNQRGKLLSALLLVQGERRIVTVSVPWHID